MIFDSWGQQQSIGACTTEEKEGKWKRKSERNIERGSSVSLSFFLLSFFSTLAILVSGSRHHEIYCRCREPIHGSGIYSTSAAPALLPRRGGLHLPRIRPVLLLPGTGIMTLESVQRTNAQCASLRNLLQEQKHISSEKCDYCSSIVYLVRVERIY